MSFGELKRGYLGVKMSKYIRCPICEAVNEDTGDEIYCRRCHQKIYHDKGYSFQVTLAYLITAMILYFPANFYPILKTDTLGDVSSNTIIGGVISLWEHGSYPIALIILLASVFVPILKFILIGYLLLSAKWGKAREKIDKQKLFYIAEVIGPWSMIDVFVVAILAALVQLNIVHIEAGTATTAFAMMVFFTLLAALSFDTRLIWEKREDDRR
jgi:paraquat-inducible protein A